MILFFRPRTETPVTIALYDPHQISWIFPASNFHRNFRNEIFKNFASAKLWIKSTDILRDARI